MRGLTSTGLRASVQLNTRAHSANRRRVSPLWRGRYILPDYQQFVHKRWIANSGSIKFSDEKEWITMNLFYCYLKSSNFAFELISNQNQLRFFILIQSLKALSKKLIEVPPHGSRCIKFNINCNYHWILDFIGFEARLPWLLLFVAKLLLI